MRKTIPIILLFFVCLNIFAQSNNEEESFGISVKGFIKTDVFFDSRQTVTAREGHFLLYPQPENNDLADEDINATPNLNMLSIQSRLTGAITGPNAFGAKSSGVLEGAFFGHSNGDINGFRLRHAFIKLDWEKTSLIVGQYWHPMFIPEVFPGVVSFNTGVPFQPFSRNPQVRVTTKLENLFIGFTAASQRDFSSPGPDGASSKYLRNSSLPILDVNLKFKKDKFVAGIGVNFKSLKPYLEYDGYKVEDNISSYSAMAFTKFDLGCLNIKMEGIYGTNLNDLLMLGGYAISNYGDNGEIDYTATKTLSAWTDISFGANSMFGLFAGFTKNLGTEDVNDGTYFSRGSSIDFVWRISPRIQHKIGNTKFAGELEYTTADYGTPDINGEVTNTTSVSNLRVLIAAYLFF
jgi:hypothetical protein